MVDKNYLIPAIDIPLLPRDEKTAEIKKLLHLIRFEKPTSKTYYVRVT